MSPHLSSKQPEGVSSNPELVVNFVNGLAVVFAVMAILGFVYIFITALRAAKTSYEI